MLIYLDNSSTTRQYDEVTDLIAEVSKNTFGNPSSLHRLGIASEKVVKNARQRVAKVIGADPEEVIFTASGTESDNTALKGVLSSPGKRGKRIITTSVEHPAVLEPLADLEEKGFEIVRLRVDDKCRIDLDELKEAINEETFLISIMAVNNEVGTIMPIREIGEIKREYNEAHGTKILFHTDCVQALGKLKINIKTDFKDVDMMSLSAHKIHGPKGVGALYIRKGVNVKPFMLGGGQERGFRSSTENVPGIAGFGLACEMAVRTAKNTQADVGSSEDFDSKVARIAGLRDRLRAGIESEISDVRINSPEDDVCSVLNVSFLKTRGEVLLHTLEQDGIYVSTGSACSSNKKNSKGSHVLNAMGLKPAEIEGAIRFSLSEFTTEEEIDYTVEHLKTAVERFRKLGSFR